MTNDKHEKYLEPLFFPAIIGTITAIFWWWWTAFNTSDSLIVTKIWAILILCTIAISLLTVIYETFILIKVLPGTVLIKTDNKIYRIIRYVVAALGFIYIVLSMISLLSVFAGD